MEQRSRWQKQRADPSERDHRNRRREKSMSPAGGTAEESPNQSQERDTHKLTEVREHRRIFSWPGALTAMGGIPQPTDVPQSGTTPDRSGESRKDPQAWSAHDPQHTRVESKDPLPVSDGHSDTQADDAVTPDMT